jgi:hypothetical protein
LVAVAKKEVKEEQNEKSFAIAKSNRKKILALIEGIEKSTPWTTLRRRVPIFVASNLASSTSPQASPSSTSMPGRWSVLLKISTSERQNLDLAKLILTADQISLNLLQFIDQIYQFICIY